MELASTGNGAALSHYLYYDVDYNGSFAPHLPVLMPEDKCSVDSIKAAIDVQNSTRGLKCSFAIYEISYFVHYAPDGHMTESITHRRFIENYPPLEDAGND